MKLTSKQYLNEEEKKKDRWRGFWLWWGLNIAMWVIFSVIFGVALNQMSTSGWGGSIGTVVTSFLPLVLNILVMVYLALTRSQMALGMLLGFASASALVLILGVVATVACFVILASGNGL